MSTLRSIWVAALPDLAADRRVEPANQKSASIVTRLQRMIGASDLRLVADAAERAEVDSTELRAGGRATRKRLLGEGFSLVARAADRVAGID